MALASDALATARSLLGDAGATFWTDAVLLPLLQEAHRELQLDLWTVGSPVVRAVSSAISVSIGAVDLGVNQPSDMINPTHAFEAASASPTAWEPMTEVTHIPLDVAQTSKLVYWCWRGERILFLGSTALRYVKLQYRKKITVPALVTDQIGITFGEIYLSARIAALAAGSSGNEAAFKLATEMATLNYKKVIEANRGQQSPPVRP
jgi:hypothetical protein